MNDLIVSAVNAADVVLSEHAELPVRKGEETVIGAEERASSQNNAVKCERELSRDTYAMCTCREGMVAM